jgi:NADH:ubiquinone oxidoreductase subunit E
MLLSEHFVTDDFTVVRNKNMTKFKMQTYQNLIKRSGAVTQENLFNLLGKVQDKFGYVPREVVRDLASRTGLAEARIYGALTSYKDFKVTPQLDN